MASSAAVLTLTLVVSLTLILNVQCNEDILSVINRIDSFEEWTSNKIDSVKISLRSELKQYLRQHVVAEMKNIFQGESIEEMVKSQVLSEVRQLKRGNHQIKRQLHRVLASYSDLQEELNTYKQSLKIRMDTRDMNTCSGCIVDSEILRRDLKQCKGNIEIYRRSEAEKDKEIFKLNQTCHMQPSDTSKIHIARVTSAPTTTSTSAPTSLATTDKPEIKKSWILVAPISSGTPYQFRKLNIDTNMVSTYRLRGLKWVVSIVYVSKLKKLLIGMALPDKIISSDLDSNDVITMRENVRTSGMTVDEERDLVFMTTYLPRYTISRMTTRGIHFTAITDLSSYGSVPRAIAVNTKKARIYACNQGKVFTVTYDGRQLQTLTSGTNMYALTIDYTGTVLYYNDNTKLMSWSQNVTREVTTLSVIPWNIKYYNDTVYFSSFASPGTVGAVDVAHETVMYTLQRNIIKGVSRYALCLVP